MLRCLISLALCAGGAWAQPAPTALERVDDYKGWGWESWVMSNGLVTVATVPEIGARIMQYDLGEHASIFVNPDETGKLYTPSGNSPWHNYGGYKTWPAPQAEWGWPPPPNLDFGVYEAEVVADTPDSVSIFVRSPVERWKTPDIRFERRTTLYPGTSRVRVEQTVVNEAATPQPWSVWDVTQNIVNHPGERDFSNFRVYFPINPNSVYGETGVRPTASSPAWLGEVAPGIYGVQFLPENKKIFADSHRGWICYTDERDGYTYAKTFDLFEGEPYPDEEARVEVWINRDPLYLEVEVVSPIVELAADGGRYTFVEDWWATKLHGPVLDVNAAGAVAGRLRIEDSRLRGTYGVFHQGTVRLAYIDAGSDVLYRSPPQPVHPFETLVLDQVPRDLPDVGPIVIQAEIYDSNGEWVGVLDRLELDSPPTAVAGNGPAPSHFALGASYPNPFNPQVTIPFSLERAQAVELAVFDVSGARIRTLVNGARAAGPHLQVWDGRDQRGNRVATGVYFYRLHTRTGQEARSMLLLR